jgi:hypothetical protein
MNGILRDADHVILGLPMLTCMGIGAAGGLLQQFSYQPVKTAGWFGTHTAIILGIVSGVPLLVYSIAKIAFAKVLNELTLNRFDCIRSFKEHAEMQFTVTIVTVSALPLIVLALPHAIQGAYKAYQTYQEVQKVYDDFTQSDLYVTLRDLYTQINQLFNKAPVSLEHDENLAKAELMGEIV